MSQPDQPDLPEQMQVRRDKLAAIRGRGGDPYPLGYPRTDTLGALRERFADLPIDTATGVKAGIAGRVLHARNTGKLCFAEVRDGTGSLQVMLSLDRVGPEALQQWKDEVDLGDHVGVTGEVITSRRGEFSVLADDWAMLAKALRPLPTQHAPMSEEARVRQRYADLIVRPEAASMVRLRADVLRSLRATLDGRGFVEVETPMLQEVHGGAAARPFTTHLNAFDLDMTLRIALELHLKRLVVGGVDRVYEIGRTFRNEGVDASHSPEFTMLEAYEAYGDYDTMAELTRALVLDAANATGRTVVPDGRGGEIDLEQPWESVTVHGSVSAALGEVVTLDTPLEALTSYAEKAGVALQPGWGAGEVVLELYEKLVERNLLAPTFVRDYPVAVRPLARPHRDDPRLAEAWDLVIGGRELAVAFSELADPVEQRARLTAQSLLAAGGDPEAMVLDEDFLRALEYGMPPTGGLGLGVDRLLMTLSGASIREVVLFPMLRPESTGGPA